MQIVKWQHYPLVAQNTLTRTFIEELTQMRRSPSTIDNYSRDLEDFLQATAEIPFATVLETDETLITRYLDGLWTRPARRGSGHQSSRDKITYVTGSNLSLNTIRRRISTIRLFYDWCIRARQRHDPLSPVPKGIRGKQRGLVSSPPSAPWIPGESQFADLLLYVFAKMSLRNQALILVLYDGALRREEVTFLRRDHVDEHTHTIKIPHELTKNKMQGRIVLSNTTWKVLQDYLREDRARLVKTYGAEDAGPLFLSESNQNAGHPISKWAITKIFDEIRKALGLPQLTPHKLRHLMLTHLMDNGLDLYEVSRYARHRSASSTEVYLHLADSKLAHQVNRIHQQQWQRLEILFQQRTALPPQTTNNGLKEVPDASQ
jgi:integrase/recombinase XerC